MHITLHPQRRDDTLTLARIGDTLTLYGRALDPSVIPESATIPVEAIDCPWICGPISREGSVLHFYAWRGRVSDDPVARQTAR